MFGLESIFQIYNARTVQAHHDVAFIGHHTLLATLEKPLFLH